MRTDPDWQDQCSSTTLVNVTGKVVLPALLSRKALVEQGQDFRNIELHIFKVKVFLIVFLHLQEIVKLQVEFQQTSSSTCKTVSIVS